MYTDENYISSKVTSAVQLLNHFSVDELKMILNDGSKFDDVMKDIIDCKDVETDKEVILASNKSLAEFNLTKETNLEELKRNILELSESGEKLYRQVENKIGKMNKTSGPNNLEEVLALLQAAAATTEEESESLVKDLLNGDKDIDSFLDEFIIVRKQMHLRRVKADKMTEMVRRRITRTDPNSFDRVIPNPVNPSHAPFYPSINSAPYPVGPTDAMPLPSANKFNYY